MKIAPELNGNNSSRRVPYFLILSLTVFVGYLTLSLLGGGLEILFLAPVSLVVLIIVIMKVGRTLRKNNAGWWPLLLSFFVISASIVLTRLSVPGVSDSRS